MALFDDIGRKITQAGQKVVQKTGEMSDTSRLNVTINEEEKKIQNNYLQIGKLYTSVHRNDPEPQFASLVQSILQSEQMIQSCRAQIQKIKGVRTCSKCGAEVSAGSAFCMLCGNPMPVENEALKGKFTVCAGCGTVVSEGMRFCTNCGRPVAPRPAAPADPAFDPAPDPRPETPAAPAVPVYDPVPVPPPAPPVPDSFAAPEDSTFAAPAPEFETAPEPPAEEVSAAAEEAPAAVEQAPAEPAAEEAEPRFCPNCGARLEDGDAFCMNCGTKV